MNSAAEWILKKITRERLLKLLFQGSEISRKKNIIITKFVYCAIKAILRIKNKAYRFTVKLFILRNWLYLFSDTPL